jgi:DNA-binding CsgD family transcriptional regulator
MPAYLHFAEALEKARDEDESFALFEQAVREYGYCSVDYATGLLPRWPIESAAEWRIDGYRSSFHWESDYAGTEFQKYDRVMPYAASRTTPWLYWDLWSRPAEHEITRRMEANVLARIASGLGIPLHGPGLRFTGAHLGSLLAPAELARLDRETRPVVTMIATLFHEHYRRLRTPAPAAAPSPLTGRERECLLWAASGKTAWETAMILTISESAVKKHLASAADKLGARTRTQAVATALQRGIIAL